MATFTRALRIIMTLSLFSLGSAAFAQSVGGTLRTDTGQGTRTIEFSATGHSGGSASGDLLLTEPFAIPDQDVDGAGEAQVRETTLSLRVDIDCLKVEQNRAVVGGQVRESSVDSFLGRRMLLTVEDNAGTEKPDRYTFGHYQSTSPTWVPSDAELRFDEGVGMTWIATDAERDDDRGISSQPPAYVDCEAFPLSSYELEDLPADGGDIQVRP